VSVSLSHGGTAPVRGLRRLVGYAFGMGAFAVALEARFLLAPVLPSAGFPFLTFFPAVLLAALLAGLGPGLLVSALSVAAAVYFFMPPAGSLALAGLPEVVATVFFAAILLVHCVVIHLMTTSQRALRAERARAADAAAVQGKLAADLIRVLEATSDGVVALGPDWRVTFMNGHARGLIAGGRDLTGQVLWEVYADAVGGPTWRAYQRCMADRVPTEAEEHYAPLGRSFAAHAFPAEGEGITVFFRDVTEERAAAARLAANEARLAAVLDNVPIGVALAEAPSGRIVMANRRVEEILGHAVAPSSGVTAFGEWQAYDPEGRRLDAQEYPLARALAGEEAPALEMCYRRGDDRLAWIGVSAAPIRDPGTGAITGAVAAVADIDAARRARESLAEGEERLRLALEAGRMGVWSWDLASDRLEWDARQFELFGMDPSAGQPSGEAALARIHPEDRPGLDAAIASALAAGNGTFDHEFRLCLPDGATRWIGGYGHAVPGPGGCAVRMVGLNFDITARRQAEAALALSGARFRAAVQAVDGILWTNNARGEMEGEQPGWAALTGQSREEYQGYGWSKAVHPEDSGPSVVAWNEAVAGRATFVFEHRVRRRDGAWRRFAVRAVPVVDAEGTISEWVGVHTDVTETREAEARLADSEARLRQEAERVDLALAAGAIIGTWNWDLTTDRFSVDERFAFAFGIDPALGQDGLPLEQVIATVHPEDLEGLRAAIAEAIGRGGAYSHEYRVRGRDGVYRWIQANGRVDHAPNGTPLRFPGVLLDVERRRAVEAERDRVNALLRTILEAVPGAVYAKDREGRMLLANRGTAELIGRPVEEILGRTARDFAPDPAAAEAIMDTDGRVVERGAEQTAEETISRPDGTAVVWLSTKAPLRDAAGRIIGLVGASVDITDRKRAEAVLARDKAELERLAEERGRALAASEARLAQASKMEALGRLAGGIAHDINNVLQAVQGGISLAAKRIHRDADEAARFLDLAANATKRGAGVTGRLLAFARRGKLSAGPVEPAPLLAGLAHILRHTLGPSVDLRLEMPTDVCAVLADADQLEAVLVNLANNARDALPGGSGIVVLRAEPVTIAPDSPRRPEGLEPGDYVRLSVADDGEGMAPDVLARVTEPFFTTKAKGQGTGLGLAMARGFAEQSGGALAIDSAPGRGTTVSLWLPRAPAGAALPARAEADAVPPLAPDGPAISILLVDDEQGVRETIEAALADRGHAVTTAENASVALAMLDAGASVEVVVTDLAMPGGMDGLELVREARRRRPGLPAVLITGYAGDAGQLALREAAGAGPFALVRKPASAEMVEAEIATLLRAGARVAE